MQAVNIPTVDQAHPSYTITCLLQKAAHNKLSVPDAEEFTRDCRRESMSLLAVVADVLSNRTTSLATDADLASVVHTAAGMLEAAELLNNASGI